MINLISDYVSPFSAFPNIAPFTYKDGETYLSTLENLRVYVNDTLVTFVNNNFELFDESFTSSMNSLISDVNTALIAQNTSVNASIATLTAYVNTQVASILGSSVTVAEGVMNSVAANTASTFIATLNSYYASKATQTTVESGRLTDANLQAAYANKATQTVVETGRLTDANLIAEFALKSVETIVTSGRLSDTSLTTKIDGRISLIDWNAQIVALLNNKTSATRVALDAIYATPKWRDWYPSFVGIAPGLTAYRNGRFYFDGVDFKWSIDVMTDTVNTAPITASDPYFKLPAVPDYPGSTKGAALKDMGWGTLISGLSGNAYPAKCLIPRSNPTVAVIRSAVSPIATVTSAVPFTWGISCGINLHGYYKPVAKKFNNFTAYGDSITRYTSTASGADGVGDTFSWVFPTAKDGLVFGGGFAQDGATSAILLANTTTAHSDVGVCLIGVNDIAGSVAQATTLNNIISIRAAAGTDKFILCKLAPYDANGSAANALNVAYATLAAAQGWTLIDPYAAFRQGSGVWTAGASSDGTHPTQASQNAAAVIIQAAILALVA